jgi:hypothetical protein
MPSITWDRRVKNQSGPHKQYSTSVAEFGSMGSRPPAAAHAGAVALGEAGAGGIVDPGWSERLGQLVEGSQDPQVDWFLGPEFVVAAADVLDEGVSCTDHSG